MVVCGAACCVEVRPDLWGGRVWWHFGERGWKWSGECVALG